MDNRDLKGLTSTVLKFKVALLETLGASYAEFQNAINGEEPLKFYGLKSQVDEPNEYLIDISDILFWHDPIAYTDELERWQGSIITEQHKATLEFLIESDQMSVFADLVEAVKKKRIAPFVGAGFSKPCHFPLWGEAISQLINRLEGVSRSEERALQPALSYLDLVRGFLNNWQYLEAAQLIYERDQTQIESFVRNKFQLTDNIKLIGPVTLLPEIADGCIITTNFDCVIETVFQDKLKPIRGYMHGIQSQNQFVPKLIQGERCILKLHGDVSDPSTYIFSENQYKDAYGEDGIDYTKPLSKVLRQIFISHSLLFLGCSLSQDMTMTLFKDIVDKREFNIPDHYAILPKHKNHETFLAKETQLLNTKIRPIWYSVGEDENHQLLEALMQLLVDCAKGKARLQL
ncbi:hypothetical protein F5984_06770 [Rudanella paleaurantiibacter]|uniref:SIR2-like domain-containing protein n=1 Tax=Rudanella paleaurantiibacter TaxID=2614655 RepID=A0A7J5U293_9BACT|nr:SIR2 family protein [Rudanella paleaurantiibacter]KAB7731919.1 hypothetical protein F5984_06770 [Rudanella paleaurantiibacter]